MPTDMAGWEKYFEVYRECMGRAAPDIGPANRYYRKHRRQLDAGAEAAWPARKGDDEVSAIQHAMNLYCERGPEAFWAEFQNEPQQDPDPSRDGQAWLGSTHDGDRISSPMAASQWRSSCRRTLPGRHSVKRMVCQSCSVP